MPKLKLTSWESRFWAWLIDIIILSVLINLFVEFLIFWNFEIFTFETVGLQSALLFAYWTISEGYKGQSIGKLALNIKVTNRKGEEIDYTDSIIESFGKAFLLPIDCLIGWLAMSGEKLRLFNKLSGTIVIKEDYEPPEGIEYEK